MMLAPPLSCQVVSGDGSPLASVLVSLSGANFRSNNFTDEEGRVQYIRLVSQLVSGGVLYNCSSVVLASSLKCYTG